MCAVLDGWCVGREFSNQAGLADERLPVFQLVLMLPSQKPSLRAEQKSLEFASDSLTTSFKSQEKKRETGRVEKALPGFVIGKSMTTPGTNRSEAVMCYPIR